MANANDDRSAADIALELLGIDVATIPEANLAAFRASLEGPEELDPRVLASRVPRYGNPRPAPTPVDATPDLDTLDPRALAALVTRDRFR